MGVATRIPPLRFACCTHEFFFLDRKAGQKWDTFIEFEKSLEDQRAKSDSETNENGTSGTSHGPGTGDGHSTPGSSRVAGGDHSDDSNSSPQLNHFEFKNVDALNSINKQRNRDFVSRTFSGHKKKSQPGSPKPEHETPRRKTSL